MDQNIGSISRGVDGVVSTIQQKKNGVVVSTCRQKEKKIMVDWDYS